MINMPLLKKELKSNLKVLLIFAAILAMYIICIVYMYDPKLGETLKAFEQAMPEIMSAFGMITSGNDLISFLNSYLFGMIFLIFPMVYTIMLANRLVVSYVDKGSMACLLATPNTRKKIVVTQIVVMALNLFLLLLFATILTVATSEIMFPGELNIPRYVLMSVCLYFLQLAISGIAFFASCLFNESKNSYMLGAGIPVIFYLVKMLANMGGNLENLKYTTIFTLLPADKIASGEATSFGDASILVPTLITIGIAVVLYTASAFIFTKRDLPL